MARILTICSVLFLAVATPAVSAEQQWLCKMHAVDPGGTSPDMPFKLVENSTTLDAYLDDLTGTASQYKIIQSSDGGVIAVLPRHDEHGLELGAFLLDKKNGKMKRTFTMNNSYVENYLGACVRSPK